MINREAPLRDLPASRELAAYVSNFTSPLVPTEGGNSVYSRSAIVALGVEGKSTQEIKPEQVQILRAAAVIDILAENSSRDIPQALSHVHFPYALDAETSVAQSLQELIAVARTSINDLTMQTTAQEILSCLYMHLPQAVASGQVIPDDILAQTLAVLGLPHSNIQEQNLLSSRILTVITDERSLQEKQDALLSGTSEDSILIEAQQQVPLLIDHIENVLVVFNYPQGGIRRYSQEIAQEAVIDPTTLQEQVRTSVKDLDDLSIDIGARQALIERYPTEDIQLLMAKFIGHKDLLNALGKARAEISKLKTSLVGNRETRRGIIAERVFEQELIQVQQELDVFLEQAAKIIQEN